MTQEVVYATTEDVKRLLEITQSQQAMIDNQAKFSQEINENLQKQINLLQQQITLLASLHKAEPNNYIDAESGLKKLHEEAGMKSDD